MTKYPIILVHGIALKDFMWFKAFGGIEDLLTAEGFIVYTSRVDGFGTTETNAEKLKEEILRILDKHDAEKINIIAHSKGGLDSKRMIRELGMADRVASLTTLCTPHKGSPIATNILRLPKPLLHMTDALLNGCYKLFGDEKPDAYAVCRELAQTGEVEEETVAFSDAVYCQSFSTTLHRSRDDFVMGIPLMFSHHFEKKKSDGMVSAESAMFANYRGECVEGSVSHSEIVDFMAGRGKREKIHDFYIALCHELATMGF